jgi:drug/metabolite transporter (DMT)-like permease
MASLWIPVTIVAAAAQTVRNATQRNLTGALGTVGATQVRFLYGLPFALVFLAIVVTVGGAAPPTPDLRTMLFAIGGALTQIAATALMLLAMRERSFGVTTALIKTEPVLTALAGIIILGDVPAPIAGIGIVIATIGVLVLSVRPGTLSGWVGMRPIAFGVTAAAFFALSAISFRGAILSLPEGSFVLRATTILVISLALQTTVLIVWMLAMDRPAMTASFRAWRQSLLAGFMGALASQFWFIGFSLTSAANVRTLALVEILFAQGVSARFMAQHTGRRELAGMGLIILGVGLLVVGAH